MCHHGVLHNHVWAHQLPSKIGTSLDDICDVVEPSMSDQVSWCLLSVRHRFGSKRSCEDQAPPWLCLHIDWVAQHSKRQPLEWTSNQTLPSVHCALTWLQGCGAPEGDLSPFALQQALIHLKCTSRRLPSSLPLWSWTISQLLDARARGHSCFPQHWRTIGTATVTLSVGIALSQIIN